MTEKVFCSEEIREILPYTYPMSMVDRLWKESDSKYIGLKNVSTTEEYFNGHFPGHPIMPGVLQIEAMMQVATIGLKKKLDPSGNMDIYMKSMSSVKFRKPATPGDRLLIEIEVIKIENNIAEVKAVNKTNAGVTCQANLTISTRPRTLEVEKPELFTDFDKDENIAMDVTQIKEYIPHRYPFLFVDYIKSVEGPNVTAIKNITYNDPILHSYYPGYSVLPGAIHAEIVAQAGCVHTLARPENKGKLALFAGIQKSEFFHPVRPGDQLKIEVVLPPSKRSSYGKGTGKMTVGDKIVSQTEIMFALVSP